MLKKKESKINNENTSISESENIVEEKVEV